GCYKRRPTLFSRLALRLLHLGYPSDLRHCDAGELLLWQETIRRMRRDCGGVVGVELLRQIKQNTRPAVTRCFSRFKSGDVWLRQVKSCRVGASIPQPLYISN